MIRVIHDPAHLHIELDFPFFFFCYTPVISLLSLSLSLFLSVCVGVSSTQHHPHSQLSKWCGYLHWNRRYQALLEASHTITLATLQHVRKVQTMLQTLGT